MGLLLRSLYHEAGISLTPEAFKQKTLQVASAFSLLVEQNLCFQMCLWK